MLAVVGSVITAILNSVDTIAVTALSLLVETKFDAWYDDIIVQATGQNRAYLCVLRWLDNNCRSLL